MRVARVPLCVFCWNSRHSRSACFDHVCRELFLNRDRIILLIDFANGSFLPWSLSVMLFVGNTRVPNFARLTSVSWMLRQGELPVRWGYAIRFDLFKSYLLRLIVLSRRYPQKTLSVWAFAFNVDHVLDNNAHLLRWVIFSTRLEGNSGVMVISLCLINKAESSIIIFKVD